MDIIEIKDDTELEFMEYEYVPCDSEAPEEAKPDDEELLFEEVDYVDVKDEETDDKDEEDNIPPLILLSQPPLKVTDFINEHTNPSNSQSSSSQRKEKCTCTEEVIKLRKEVEELKKYIKRKDKEMQMQIALHLSQTKREIQEIASSSIQFLIESKGLVTAAEYNDSVVMPLFPVETDQGIVELNELLSKNKGVKRVLFNTLRKLGGKTLRHYISRTMRYLLVDSVAYFYTWEGLGNNKCFKDHKYLSGLVIAVANEYSDSITVTQIEKEMRTYFHSAHDRQAKLECRKEKRKNEYNSIV